MFNYLSSFDALLMGACVLILAEIVMVIRKVPLKQNLLYSAIIAYLVFIASITLFPISFVGGASLGYNFIPFANLIDIFVTERLRTIIWLVVGNIVAFMPFGFLLSLIRGKTSLIYILLATMLYSICIEFSQFLVGQLIGYGYRHVDIDDVILNTLGGVLGYAMYKLMPKKLTKTISLNRGYPSHT